MLIRVCLMLIQVSDDESKLNVPDLSGGMSKSVSLPLIEENNQKRVETWARSSSFHPFSDTDITPLVRYPLLHVTRHLSGHTHRHDTTGTTYARAFISLCIIDVSLLTPSANLLMVYPLYYYYYACTTTTLLSLLLLLVVVTIYP